jgi:hypothetical protein
MIDYYAKEAIMSDKTRRIVRFASAGIAVAGIVGLYVSGAKETDVSNVVKLGTMIAAIAGSLISTLLPRK